MYILNPSDLITSLSFLVIPIVMVYIWRVRRDLPFTGIFLMFGVFILCSGTTHFIAVWNFWDPTRALIAMTIFKFITAVVSFITGLMVIHSIPLALSIPSRQLLEQEIKVQLRILLSPILMWIITL
jgi:uncharacterized membrane protein